jgi:hypothetical protein
MVIRSKFRTEVGPANVSCHSTKFSYPEFVQLLADRRAGIQADKRFLNCIDYCFKSSTLLGNAGSNVLRTNTNMNTCQRRIMLGCLCVYIYIYIYIVEHNEPKN